VSPGVVVPGTRGEKGPKSPVVAIKDHDQTVLRAVGAVIILATAGVFLWFAPMTYGVPGCSAGRLAGMKWLDTWDFHFAK